MRSIRFFYCYVLVLVFGCHTAYSASDITPYWQTIETKQLWQEPYWHKLMYYNVAGKGYNSDVPDAVFFLDKKGSTDPKAELHRLLEQLFLDNAAIPDANIACVYPARAAWLREQLQLDPSQLATPSCPRLQSWLASIAPKYTTLVFSSGYVNNPSSMYGHTLLRIDSNEDQSQRLISYAINYAALSDKETGLKYAYKGLTGGFDGGYSLVPYYTKVREYGAAEHRDLWEYELNLTSDETLRMVQHFWEMRFVHIPYYYININCSYELLALLDIARPGLELRKHFRWMTLPTDTLRVTLNDTGLLKKIHFRPAQSSILATQINASPAPVISATQQLLDDPNADFSQMHPALLNKTDQARSLSLAADVLYQKHKTEAKNNNEKRQHILTLMQRRSQLDVAPTDITTPTPSIDPSQGHETRRFMAGVGYGHQRVFTDLELRPSYHDLLDPSAGYQDGAAISLLRTRLRLDKDNVYLKTFEAVAIQTMDMQNSLQKPKSWGIATGLRETEVPVTELSATISQSTDPHHTVAYATGNMGMTYAVDKARCYALLAGEAEAGSKLRKGWAIGVGSELGCLYNSTAVNIQLGSKTLFWLPSEQWQTALMVGLQLPLDAKNGVRLGFQKNIGALKKNRQDEFLLSLVHYF